jgi:hypothetical protein
MRGMIELLFDWLVSLLKSQQRLQVENLVLRHQINILCRQSPRCTRLSNPDRLVFVWLYRLQPVPRPQRAFLDRCECLLGPAFRKAQSKAALQPTPPLRDRYQLDLVAKAAAKDRTQIANAVDETPPVLPALPRSRR